MDILFLDADMMYKWVHLSHEGIDSYISLFNQSADSYHLIERTLKATGLETRVNWRNK